MPPRRRSDSRPSTSEFLTTENLQTLAEAVAEGKRATVYLREATPSLNLLAGASAKVVSVQGSTVIIRPKGVNDELPFEAEELRMTRLPTRTATPKTAIARTAASTPGVTASSGPTPTKETPVEQEAVVAPSAPASVRNAAPRRPKKVPSGLSVTIHASADNDWTVTVTHGARRPTKAVPVTPDAVERAVRELGDPVALEAVESLIAAARQVAEERVQQLSQQLAEARKALEVLSSASD